jgi:hypothetical protein
MNTDGLATEGTKGAEGMATKNTRSTKRRREEIYYE